MRRSSRIVSIYRSLDGRNEIQRWCLSRLDEWPVRHDRRTVEAAGVPTHVVTAGTGAATAVFVAGTNFNAATSLPIATALVTTGYRVVLPDVPGQPGLSSDERELSGGRSSWYGTWLRSVLEQVSEAPAVVVGHSFGATIALSCSSPRIGRLVLVSPGGLTRLRLTPALLAAFARWSIRPGTASSARLLGAMHAPDHRPRSALVDWMTLVGRHSRSSGAPDAVELPARAVNRLVLSGEEDVFLPPRRLAAAVRRSLDTELGVIAGAGHLVVEEHPEYLASLIARQHTPGGGAR